MNFAAMCERSEWIRLYKKGLIIQRKKNPVEVEREYNEEKWNEVFHILEDHPEIKDIYSLEKNIYGKALCSGVIEEKEFCINENIWFSKKQIELYANEIIPLIKDNNTVIEIGAGYGSIIFKLMDILSKENVMFFAGEYAENGIYAMNAISKRVGKNLVTGKCDFFSCFADDCLKNGNNGLLFTSYAIMYVPWLKDNFVEYLLSFNTRFGIHFEPCYEYHSDETEYGSLCRKYIEFNDYNRNLVAILKKAEMDGTIRIVKVIKHVFGENFLCPLSVIVWEKVGRKQ